MTDPQPDQELADAWQQFSLATDEKIQANMREFVDAFGYSMEEFAEGLRLLLCSGFDPGSSDVA